MTKHFNKYKNLKEPPPLRYTKSTDFKDGEAPHMAAIEHRGIASAPLRF